MCPVIAWLGIWHLLLGSCMFVLMATSELTPSKVDMVYEEKRSFLRRISNSAKHLKLQSIPCDSDVPYANTVFECARVLASMGVSSTWIRRNSRKLVVATPVNNNPFSVVNPTIVPSRLNLEELPPLPDHRDSPQQRDEGSNADYCSCSSSPPGDVIPETNSCLLYTSPSPRDS